MARGMTKKDCGEFFTNKDAFAGEMPNFNIKGKKSVGTCFGFSLTFILTVIMII
jgi:hypothetical protein